MSEYDNTNRGSIWPNDKKLTDSHPDFKGSLNVNGVEFWVSAWKRKPDANPKSPSLSFSIQEKEVKGDSRPSNTPVDDDFSDSIPF